jgi:secreted PhoX family phosphatase
MQMKKTLLSAFGAVLSLAAMAQIPFPVNIDTSWSVPTVWMPKSPLKLQVLFVGGVDTVETTATYGNPAGKTVAKQWHDFIGFTPDKTSGTPDLGWVSVNHEMIQKNDMIGDGGGMTVFKLRRLKGDVLEIVPQTLNDGRAGKFFNVDFTNVTGETGMNCAGISAPDGRIWTAEEWLASSNANISSGMRDTSDFTIGVTTPAGFPGLNGKTLKKFQNWNWMVEIDPKQAKAIRKQYNWGRAGWEGGAMLPDNKTVFLGEDATPGMLVKFVANTPGDFNSGTTYIYKHDAPGKWIVVPDNLDTLLTINKYGMSKGATMFTRLEWVAYNKGNGKVYVTETGNDNPGNAFKATGVVALHLVKAYKDRYKTVTGTDFPNSDAAAADSVRNGAFKDYYGRVLELDLTTNDVKTYIEGGPFNGSAASKPVSQYPSIHLSNPDGLNFMHVGNKDYMLISEDLNGRNWGRTPAEYQGSNQTVCELYLLDMSIPNPTFNDIIRIAACPPGAEITGAIALDSKTMLMNSQHPATTNTYPYNNSLTYAISGWDGLPTALNEIKKAGTATFTVFPNPVARELNLDKVMDVAIYNMAGQRLKVYRDVKSVDVTDLASGTYIIMNDKGESLKFVVE